MSNELVTVERQGHVLLIGMNRPEKEKCFEPGYVLAVSKSVWAAG